MWRNSVLVTSGGANLKNSAFLQIIDGLDIFNPERRYSGGVKFKRRQRRESTLF